MDCSRGRMVGTEPQFKPYPFLSLPPSPIFLSPKPQFKSYPFLSLPTPSRPPSAIGKFYPTAEGSMHGVSKAQQIQHQATRARELQEEEYKKDKSIFLKAITEVEDAPDNPSILNHNDLGLARVGTEQQSRRSGNYKPNIWKYDFLESLTIDFAEEEYKRRVEKLKENVVYMLIETVDLVAKLELIDSIEKLGLGNLFEQEIKEALNSIVLDTSNNPRIKEDLYATALFFRLVRQHGFNVSQDIFSGLIGETGAFMKSTNFDIKTVVEVFEATYLALEGENILVEAKTISIAILKNIMSSNFDNKVVEQLGHALGLPLHWRVQWYDVKRHIHELENKDNNSLLKLAKLHFNMVQATHQKDLKEISRWWMNLQLMENLSFSRDRLVESYLWAMGVAFEPQYGSFRKWLTKAIIFIIVIDDVYDIYGSLEELECFTNAVQRFFQCQLKSINPPI